MARAKEFSQGGVAQNSDFNLTYPLLFYWALARFLQRIQTGDEEDNFNFEILEAARSAFQVTDNDLEMSFKLSSHYRRDEIHHLSGMQLSLMEAVCLTLIATKRHRMATAEQVSRNDWDLDELLGVVHAVSAKDVPPWMKKPDGGNSSR